MNNVPENLENGFSGMARIDDDNFLVVHDYKSFGSSLYRRRLGYVNVQSSGSTAKVSYRYLSNKHRSGAHIEGWPGASPAASGRLASDLESACALGGHPNQFLVAESSSYDGNGGQIFRIDLDSNIQEYEVATDPAYLPGLDPNTGKRTLKVHSRTKNQSVENYEGLACWQMTGGREGKYLVLLGERGATAPDPSSRTNGKYRRATATLQWAIFDPGNNAFSWREPINGIVAPGMHSRGDSGCWRDISGLYVDADRKIWATAAYDAALDDKSDPCYRSAPPGGRNYSVLYQLGAICSSVNDTILANRGCAGHASYPAPARLRNFTISRKVDGFKVEAVAAPQGRGNPNLTVASEDEDGGSWWNRR